jgi:hypothetical protein
MKLGMVLCHKDEYKCILYIFLGYVTIFDDLICECTSEGLVEVVTPDGSCLYETAKRQSDVYASVGTAASCFANI